MAAWWNKPVQFGPPMSEAWRLAVRNLVVQTLLVIMAGMLLDDGFILRHVLFASLCWWLAAGFILLRRQRNLSRLDRMFLEGGMLLMLLISAISSDMGWFRSILTNE